MAVRGIEGLSSEQVLAEIRRGARFIVFTYTVSVLILTLRRPTDVYFVRAGESGALKSLPYTLITLVFGWWGIPFGPIYSIWTLAENLSGGKDVTNDLVRMGPG